MITLLYLLALTVTAVLALRAWQKPDFILHHIVLGLGILLTLIGFMLVQMADGAPAVLMQLLITLGVMALTLAFLVQKLP